MTAAPVGVVGAGAMGTGIAQVAAVAGRRVLLFDAAEGAAEGAVTRITEQVATLAAKGRLNADPAALALSAVSDVSALADCEVVIEAIIEDLAAKKALLADLEQVVGPDCVLASNSSSLSPTAMAAGRAHPERLVGLHFFNPAPRMDLVEVISGLATSPAVARQAATLARDWGKTVVFSAATPAFIVNRIARPYYAEAWRVHAERAASFEVIDAVLTGPAASRWPVRGDGPDRPRRQRGGHPVGVGGIWLRSPVRAVPRAAGTGGGRLVWPQDRPGCYGYPRKDATATATATAAAGQGRAALVPESVIEYGPTSLTALLARTGARVEPGDPGDDEMGLLDGTVELPSGAVLDRCNGATASSVSFVSSVRSSSLTGRWTMPPRPRSPSRPATAARPLPSPRLSGFSGPPGTTVHVIDDIPGMIVTRTVAMLANLAADAVASGVASAEDVELAMRLGVNYPRGPIAWGQQWGTRTVLTILDSLENWYRDGRYRAAPALRRAVLAGGGPMTGMAGPGASLPLPRNPSR